jgi:hypothetical protein
MSGGASADPPDIRTAIVVTAGECSLRPRLVNCSSGTFVKINCFSATSGARGSAAGISGVTCGPCASRDMYLPEVSERLDIDSPPTKPVE